VYYPALGFCIKIHIVCVFVTWNLKLAFSLQHTWGKQVFYHFFPAHQWKSDLTPKFNLEIDFCQVLRQCLKIKNKYFGPVIMESSIYAFHCNTLHEIQYFINLPQFTNETQT
jgi:hypothetical protein